jgi:hypothetical protein
MSLLVCGDDVGLDAVQGLLEKLGHGLAGKYHQIGNPGLSKFDHVPRNLQLSSHYAEAGHILEATQIDPRW